MKNFRKGDELICLNGGWKFEDHENVPDVLRDQVAQGPKKNEIVTCEGYEEGSDQWIFLKEYPGEMAPKHMASFDEYHFEKLVSNSQLYEDLKPETMEQVWNKAARERHRSKAWI